MRAVADRTVVDEIASEVLEDGVYVAPALRQQVDAAEEAAIEAAVARIDAPVRVVALPLRDDDMFAGNVSDLLTRVHDTVDGDGWYVAPAYVFSDGTYRLQEEEWASSYDASLDLSYDALGIAHDLHPNDLGAGLVELTTAMADGTVPEKVAEARVVRDQRRAEEGLPPLDDPSSSDTDGHPGLVVGIVAVVLVLLVVAVLRARARAGGLRRAVTPPARRQYQLPASVLDRVREADADRLAARADREVLALGERIDGAEITDSADRAAWQTALDHYDAARRVAARTSGDPLDSVGEIVLAGRGDRALDAALAGRTYEPETPCFLNPLHGVATATRRIDHADRLLEAPLCRTCRQDLAAGRAPDVLDVVRDGTAVHYFDTGVEPWASTGYGALHADLVGALHRRSPGR
jgi:hypothetical protein